MYQESTITHNPMDCIDDDCDVCRPINEALEAGDNLTQAQAEFVLNGVEKTKENLEMIANDMAATKKSRAAAERLLFAYELK